jgi:glutamyl-tRNA synthetase
VGSIPTGHPTEVRSMAERHCSRTGSALLAFVTSLMSTVRVRFAPSPTGYLHVGGLRTALYNYLFARRNNGVFILRIEDTDRTRTVDGAIDGIINMLRWCGLDYDEGPVKGGAFGPYIQSERLAIYRDHADQLLASGNAYRCFCTPERLDHMRSQQQAQKLPPMYDRRCRQLTEDDVAAKLAEKVTYVVRMKVPLHGEVVLHDVVRGTVSVQGRLLDDQVLLKTDGFPTYHLANVVDDHLMEITHVIRGEEWLPSAPKHVILYNAFGWQPPQFAHLPLLLNADKSKLSKRQGDVAVEDYKAQGFLPEALVNFVALLGWNPTGDREVYSLPELAEQFDLTRVNKAGAVFDLQKLSWMNAQYLRADTGRIVEELHALVAARGYTVSGEYVAKVVEVMKDRASTVNDFVEFSDYFFRRPVEFDAAFREKHWKPESAAHMVEIADACSALPSFDVASIEACVRGTAMAHGVKPAQLIHPIRLSLTGKGVGPGLFELIDVLGRDETVARLRAYAANG